MATPAPHFYNLTLSPPQTITHSITGSFSGLPKTQEIIVSRGTRIELLRPDPATGRVETILEHEVFGTVRSLAGFRLTGASKGACPLALLWMGFSWQLFLLLPSPPSSTCPSPAGFPSTCRPRNV